jgi:hypothetical protein
MTPRYRSRASSRLLFEIDVGQRVAVGVADDEARLLLLGVRLARAFAAELMNARKRGQGEKFKTTPSKVAE